MFIFGTIIQLTIIKNTVLSLGELVDAIQMAGILWGITIPCFLIDQFTGESLLQYICIAFGTLLINAWGEYFIEYIILRLHKEQLRGMEAAFFYNVLTFTIVLLYWLLYERKKPDRKVVHIIKIQYVMFLCGVLSFGMLCGSVEYLQAIADIPAIDSAAIQVLISGISVVFVSISIWQGVIIKRQVAYQVKNEMYEQYMKEQEQYMKLILMKDEKMRKFRHDMNAHMRVLQAYSEGDKKEELAGYLNQIKADTALYDVKKYTGYSAIDAMAGQLLEDAENRGIQVTWRGQLPENMEISLYDLCTLFSNLITNAIEAAGKLPKGEGWIKTIIYVYNGKTYICIKNNYCEVIQKNNQGKFISSKMDKDKHGIGTQNIEAVVKKYSGDISIQYNSGVFCTEIIF